MAQVLQNPSVPSAAPRGLVEMPVAKSKVIQHVSYDPQSLQMTVTMKNGAQYIHFYVYPNVMDDFIKAGSKGEFYSKVVKGKHPATRQVSKNVGKAIKK